MKFTIDELAELDRISDMNLVHYYLDELRAGALADLPSGVRSRLRKHGIIGFSSKAGFPGSGFRLMDRGRALLEEVIADRGSETLPRPSRVGWADIDLCSLIRLCFEPPRSP